VLLRASTVVTPDGVLLNGEVEVGPDGLIVAVRAAPPGAAVPDRVLAPGFVDVQVNGMGDVDCAAAKAPGDWDRIDEALLASGVTAWCPTLVTAPLPAFGPRLDRIAEAMARPPTGDRPTMLGAHLEGPFLGGAPGAHPRDWLSAVDLDWLAQLPDIVRVVTLAPEIEHAIDAIRLLAGRGVVVSLGHSTATYERAVAATDAGARLVTHLFNGMAPLHHRSPGLVGAALADRRLIPSLIADGVHVHPAVLAATARAKGTGGWILVTDVVATAPATRLAAREVRIVDGAPRLPDGTLAGSVVTMDAAVRRMVVECGLPLEDVVAAASTTPAQLLGLADRGAIEVGRRADLVALTPVPELRVDRVWST
jgi:N-acetylglucosamine-6-phosphate deacetylase